MLMIGIMLIIHEEKENYVTRWSFYVMKHRELRIKEILRFTPV